MLALILTVVGIEFVVGLAIFFVGSFISSPKIVLSFLEPFENPIAHLLLAFISLLIAAGVAVVAAMNLKVRLHFFPNSTVVKFTIVSILSLIFLIVCLYPFAGELSFAKNSVELGLIVQYAFILLMRSVYEEVTFRFLPLLWHSKFYVYVLSGILFTFLHLFNAEFDVFFALNVFVLSIFLSLITYFSGSIYPAIIFHFLWNFLNGPVLGIPVSGLKFTSVLETKWNFIFNLPYNHEIGLESSLLLTILLSINLLLIYTFFRKKQKPEVVSVKHSG